MKRVVVTGMGAVTALGNSWAEFRRALESGTSGIRLMPEWAAYRGLNTQVAGPVDHFVMPAHFPRKKVRSMGRVSQLAAVASESALAQAGLLQSSLRHSGRMGIAYGSSTGSTDAICDFAARLSGRDLSGVTATNYIKMMSNTTAVNLSVCFEIQGRSYSTSTACTSGSQAIGYAFEAIASGKQDMMLAGGAEELCPSEAAVFDTFRASSRKNHSPQQTPSPFDAERDGLVIGEGAASLVLEEYEHAKARGAMVYGEVIGFATNCDGGHVTQPDAASMEQSMTLALLDARLSAADIDYVNMHGTATEWGDIAESNACYNVYGEHVPVSSIKGHIGHSLGASGAIEAWACLHMLADGVLAPTLNLHHPDSRCAPLNYLKGALHEQKLTTVVSNNFAFGGVNTSLILRAP
ncbi:beta-ketoacyl-ACP synthase [Gilvimarinus sp. DA14]|uniref:beta-ketoacyl-ACP synthase n=1 Tax=Gilvimarinus sp. DA14 TaxID=2956798 RepID=UPI0020B731F1|nr:beta-ketoacyl-ACP synthase [Gilvimarinus sp. DA14]UTF59738.1 beta-ketoacyl-ACP synthase [Gilvimarinus sp. DA14]